MFCGSLFGPIFDTERFLTFENFFVFGIMTYACVIQMQLCFRRRITVLRKSNVNRLLDSEPGPEAQKPEKEVRGYTAQLQTPPCCIGRTLLIIHSPRLAFRKN
jgi:hypothetical protein